MFKRFALSVIIAFVVFGAEFLPQALAQEAVIVNIEGKVYLRSDAQSDWREAKIGQNVSA